MGLPLLNLLKQLSLERRVFLPVHGWHLCLEYSADNGLHITTPVYRGENYMPGSVRQALLSDPFQGVPHLKTHLTLDETFFTITLHYTGSAADLQQGALLELLEDFAWQAEQWWIYFDDHDKRDLVHTRVK